MSEAASPIKSIPANMEAEQAVLGSLLIDPDAIIKVANFLRPEDFFRERHSWIYDAMLALNERREPLDFVTLVDELERREKLEEVGGPAYITELSGNTPTSIYVDHYARIVERTALLRRLISAAGKIAELAYDESQDVDAVVDSAEQLIFGVSESRIHRDLTPIRSIMTNVVDRIDFLSHNKDTLMGVPSGFASIDKMLGGLQKSDLIILAARPGMGKCVTADTRLVDPDTGELYTIEALVHAQQARLLTLNHEYRLNAACASDFIDDGEKPVFRVETALGRSITVTLTHPFLTIDGWKPLGELDVGTRIAVPRIIPVFGQDDTNDHEAKVLAYLLADGCLTGTSPQFTNISPNLRADFVAATKHFPGTKASVQTSNGTRTPSIFITSDFATASEKRRAFGQALAGHLRTADLPAVRLAKKIGVSPSLIHQWKKGNTVPSVQTAAQLNEVLDISLDQLLPEELDAIRTGGPNLLTQWLQEQGIWGKNAQTKEVPAVVFRYSRRKLGIFLNRLFACDGSLYIQNKSQTVISYSTTSQRLAHDVQHLLLRFGILSKLRTRQVKYKGTLRRAYELRITDAMGIKCFCQEIGVLSKEAAVEKLLSHLQNRIKNTNRDTIPMPIWQRILDIKGGQSWRSIYKKMGLPESANIHAGIREPSRQRLLDLAQALKSDKLAELAQSDIYWDEIVKIDYVGERQVYDLTVPDTHNFVADDLIVHNTSLVLSLAQNAAKGSHARVGIFSLEMANEQMVQRLLAMETGIDSHRLRLGDIHENEWDIVYAAANTLANTSIFIDDTPAASVNEIRTKARRLYAEHGLDLLIIDYMQLMTGQGSGRNENRQQEISYISRSLKGLARELNVPVLACSQLSRAVESRADKRPMLSDLRESGSIEQDADIVMFIYREDYYIEDTDRQNITDIIVAKHRHGSTGTVSLYFRKELTQFSDLEIERTELDY